MERLHAHPIYILTCYIAWNMYNFLIWSINACTMKGVHTQILSHITAWDLMISHTVSVT